MKIEPWQAIYIVGVFIGLLIGWYLDPYLGAAFIWILVIVVEVLHTKRKKPSEEETEEEKVE